MERLLMAILLAAPAFAQFEPSTQKLVTLKYADPQAIYNLIRMFEVQVQVNEQLKVMALSGKKANLEAAEAAIKQLDVPSAAQKNIEITIYFVAGTDQANTPVGSAIPQDLQATVTQLRNSFPFKNYGLVDVLSLRARSGVKAETSGQYGKRITQFSVRSATLDADGSMIRLDNLKAGLRNPIQVKTNETTYVDTGISAEVVDVKVGQQLVIGRSSMEGPEKALFLVLIAKVVQ